MQTTAAVMRALDEPLSIEEIELDEPRAGEVLIRMAAVGICGSDRHVLEGHFPSSTPSVCGHEGAGVVEAVGEGVDSISVGDHVIQTFVGPCGRCNACRRGKRTFCTAGWSVDGRLPDGTYRMHGSDGVDIGTTLGLGSFSSHTVSPARNCVVVPGDVDLGHAALVACGVSTGIGSVLNVARMRPGDSVAVIGVGGVGAAAIMGAQLGGAGLIVGVDVHDRKRSAAEGFGASHFVNARETDVADALRELTNGWGVDCVILTVDRTLPEHYTLALEALAPGGIAVQVGSSTSGLDHLPVSPSVFTRKQVSFTGTVYGGMDPALDAAKYLELYRDGRLDLESLITTTYRLDQINDAFDDLAAGHNIRGVIRFDDSDSAPAAESHPSKQRNQ
ncbi:MAG: alcohol dehydrogenase catalytic domain-containing protein [Ilumatobacteraceae bacterium]|nr:alcohol dehydrogenase catalytic domain-containing protein [Ilumatobacteraceae bacterium]